MDRRPSKLELALERLTRRRVPGISAAVVTPDGPDEVASTGLADVSTGTLATPDTIYLWFSMTKIVTATAVMQLAEDGALALDDAVETFLPEFPRPRSGWPTVKIRHLLSHSAGLSNPMPLRWVHRADERGPDARQFTRELLTRHHRLRSPAGSKAVYSNIGYIALGEVIATASGRSYEDFVRARILEPLSMTQTGFRYPAGGDHVATGYQPRSSPMTPLFRVLLPKGILGPRHGRYVAFNRFLVDGVAYGGLVGPVGDAARFLALHLGGGELGGTRLLAPESVQAMQTFHTRGPKLDVGYGWYRRRSDRGEGDFCEHLGGGGGFWNMMRMYRGRQVGIVVMGNVTGYDHGSVADAAVGARPAR